MDGRSPTSCYCWQFAPFTAQPHLFSPGQEKALSSPTLLDSKHLLHEPNSQNCTHKASSHKMTQHFVFEMPCLKNNLYLSLRHIIRASNRVFFFFSVSILALSNFCYKKMQSLLVGSHYYLEITLSWASARIKRLNTESENYHRDQKFHHGRISILTPFWLEEK